MAADASSLPPSRRRSRRDRGPRAPASSGSCRTKRQARQTNLRRRLKPGDWIAQRRSGDKAIRRASVGGDVDGSKLAAALAFASPPNCSRNVIVSSGLCRSRHAKNVIGLARRERSNSRVALRKVRAHESRREMAVRVRRRRDPARRSRVTAVRLEKVCHLASHQSPRAATIALPGWVRWVASVSRT